MPDPAAGAASDRPRQTAFRDADGLAWPIVAIAVLLCAQLTLVFTHAVNWDEFFHYAQMYKLANGEPVQALQTLYLRPYVPLVGIAGSSVDHILLARLGQWLCEGAILAGIYAAARRFVSPIDACLAVLAYLTTGYVLQNGFALRADPMLTAMLMAAVAVLARAPLDWRTTLTVGVLTGLAAIVSIKAGLYLTVFAGLAWLRWAEAGRSLRSAALLAAVVPVAAATFAVLYLGHVGAMPEAGGTVQQSEGIADAAARRMFFIGRPNNLGMIVGAIATGLGIFALIVAAPFAIARKTRTAPERIALAGMWLPVLLPAFYENSAAYFYVFMLAPVAVACAVAIALVRRRLPAISIAALLVALAAPTVIADNRNVIGNQRRILAEVDRLFPAPVAYFDHAHLVARFAKRNPFQTPWGYRGYLAAGHPIYAEAMTREPVPLLIADWRTFQSLFAGDPQYFLPNDAVALSQTYLPFNGPIRIAGKVVPPGAPRRVEILVPGPYTVHDAPLIIGQRVLEPGAVVQLARGHYALGSAAPERAARLIWGKRLAPRDDLSGMSTWVRF